MIMVRTGEIKLASLSKRAMVNVTKQVQTIVRKSKIEEGVCALHAQGATAAVVVMEGADPNIALDMLDCLSNLIPEGKWRHDQVDNNGAAHIEAAWVGPSETLPVRNGKLLLSTWQNIFFCEFDGPRRSRKLLCTVIGE